MQNQHKKDENEFIHALASPIGGVELLLEMTMEDLMSGDVDIHLLKEKIFEAMAGVERVKVILTKRRSELNGN